MNSWKIIETADSSPEEAIKGWDIFSEVLTYPRTSERWWLRWCNKTGSFCPQPEPPQPDFQTLGARTSSFCSDVPWGGLVWTILLKGPGPAPGPAPGPEATPRVFFLRSGRLAHGHLGGLRGPGRRPGQPQRRGQGCDQDLRRHPEPWDPFASAKIWLWLKKKGTKMAPWPLEPKTKSCVTPLLKRTCSFCFSLGFELRELRERERERGGIAL